MKILLFNLWANQEPHWATALELMEKHLLQGDEVELVYCNGELPFCDANFGGQTKECLYCCRKTVEGLNALSKPVKSYTWGDIVLASPVVLPEFEWTMDGLRNLKVEDFDLGYGVLSSYVSMLRNPEPDLLSVKDKLTVFLQTALEIYYKSEKIISEVKPDKVYFFNGRWAYVRPTMQAAQKLKVEFVAHERGCNIAHYECFENVMPHSIQYANRRMMERWEQAAATDLPLARSIGERFFMERRCGVKQAWISFTKDQERARLPENFDHNGYNIALFNSSEDEFVAIGSEWKRLIYPDQFTAFCRIIEDLSQRELPEKFHIYLRLHPNLQYADPGYQEKYLNLHAPFLTVIAPTDKIDSYALMMAADKVLTFGSTMGIEAVFAGKVSISADVSMYRALDATYNVTTHEELIDKLLDRTLLPKDSDRALIYGYYMSTFGRSFDYVQPIDLLRAAFKGKELGLCSMRKYVLKNLFNFSMWRILLKCYFNRRKYHRSL